MSKTYKTGQTPQVGDTVSVSDLTDLPYYSQLKNHTNGLKITGVVAGIKSTLVSIDKLSGTFKASRFSLMTAASGAKPAPVAPIRFRVVSSNGQLVANASDLASLKTQLEKLLLENPGKAFEVYQYMATAAAKLPEVELIDRTPKPDPTSFVPTVGEPGITSILPAKNVVNSQQMFTKR